MATLSPVSSRQMPPTSTYLPTVLDSCTYVFVRRDSVKKPLQPPYDGPFRVIHRNSKYYQLEMHERQDGYSVSRQTKTGSQRHTALPSFPRPKPSNCYSSHTTSCYLATITNLPTYATLYGTCGKTTSLNKNWSTSSISQAPSGHWRGSNVVNQFTLLTI